MAEVTATKTATFRGEVNEPTRAATISSVFSLAKKLEETGDTVLSVSIVMHGKTGKYTLNLAFNPEA